MSSPSWRWGRRLAVASLLTYGTEFLATVWPTPVSRGLAWACAAATTVVGAGIAVYIEGRVYRRWRRRSAPALRVLLTGAAVLALSVAAAGVLRAVLHAFWLDSLLLGSVVLWGWAYAAASGGTALVRAVDAGLDRFRPLLRVKVLVMIVLLGALAFLQAMVLAAVVEFFQTVAAWAPGTTVTLGVFSSDISGEDLVRFFAEQPFRVSVVVHLLAFAMSLPAALSAVFKLAGSVVDGLAPLSGGFRRLSAGERDFAIAEAGPRDLAALSRQFNETVVNLRLSEKMERAFGTYVSTSLLERIRQQHGEASIPATLREATVFFADVRGFTAMSERLSPEQVLDLLNRYYERVVAIVKQHEGYLDKFIGDAVVVVFNVPVDQPDHAARAVACAIDIQQEIARLNQAGAFPEIGRLEVGVGIATGPMIAGNVGSREQMEYTVIGDTVNLAARFCGHAPAGEVWTNAACAASLDGARHPAEALPAIAVKGKTAKVTPHRVWPRED